MTSKKIKIGAVLAIVAVAAYWYLSPYVVVWQLKLAAQSRDATAFNEHVDYPRVRESLKEQFSIMFANKLGTSDGSGNAMAGVGAAFGAKLGMVMVNQFVDAIVRPETLMRVMQRGQLSLKAKEPSDTPPASADNTDRRAGAEPKSNKLKWDYERQGVNTVFAYAIDPKKPDEGNQDKFGLVLQRSGFATWKLVEIRLSALNK